MTRAAQAQVSQPFKVQRLQHCHCPGLRPQPCPQGQARSSLARTSRGKAPLVIYYYLALAPPLAQPRTHITSMDRTDNSLVPSNKTDTCDICYMQSDVDWSTLSKKTFTTPSVRGRKRATVAPPNFILPRQIRTNFFFEYFNVSDFYVHNLV